MTTGPDICKRAMHKINSKLAERHTNTQRAVDVCVARVHIGVVDEHTQNKRKRNKSKQRTDEIIEFIDQCIAVGSIMQLHALDGNREGVKEQICTFARPKETSNNSHRVQCVHFG